MNEYTVCVAGWKGVSPTPSTGGYCTYHRSVQGWHGGITSYKGVDIHRLATPVTHVSFIHRVYDVHDLI